MKQIEKCIKMSENQKWNTKRNHELLLSRNEKVNLKDCEMNYQSIKSRTTLMSDKSVFRPGLKDIF